MGHNHMGSSSVYIIVSRFQAKPKIENSEILVMGFGVISSCQVLFWDQISQETGMYHNWKD